VSLLLLAAISLLFGPSAEVPRDERVGEVAPTAHLALGQSGLLGVARVWVVLLRATSYQGEVFHMETFEHIIYRGRVFQMSLLAPLN
jgi:hypothetical protein